MRTKGKRKRKKRNKGGNNKLRSRGNKEENNKLRSRGNKAENNKLRFTVTNLLQGYLCFFILLPLKSHVATYFFYC
jgi:hypothetical protein